MTSTPGQLKPPAYVLDRWFGEIDEVENMRRLDQEPLDWQVRAGRGIGVVATTAAALASEAVAIDWAIQSESLPIVVPWTDIVWVLPAESLANSPWIAAGAVAVAATGLFASRDAQAQRARLWRDERRQRRLARRQVVQHA